MCGGGNSHEALVFELTVFPAPEGLTAKEGEER